MSPRKILLIDGNGFMYRSFFAIRGLSTGDGQPTNALFGFIRAMRQIGNEYEPTHCVVVFDGGLPAERTELCKEYKAQRDPMPDELSPQFVLVEDYLDVWGIPWLRMENEEADDVLATLCDKALADGANILLATSDKDLFQLVGEHVTILTASKANKLMRSEQVIDKTGVRPDQIVEWLAMVGDSSDNIAGVPGVGAKTAAKLLNQFGTLDAMWAGIDQVSSERIRNALLENRERVEVNTKLIRLRKDLGCELDWAGCEFEPEKPELVAPFLEEYELGSLAKELGRGA